MNVKEAEEQIAKTLSQLELDTGNLIESISVKDVEVTMMGDDRMNLIRKVQIEMFRLPGQKCC